MKYGARHLHADYRTQEPGTKCEGRLVLSTKRPSLQFKLRSWNQ
jgi:hypothetical protein